MFVKDVAKANEGKTVSQNTVVNFKILDKNSNTYNYFKTSYNF